MGRRKITIKEIKQEKARQVAFSKRRQGLFKKAYELSVLCGAEIAILAYSPGRKPYSYGGPTFNKVVNRFFYPNVYLSDNEEEDADSEEEDDSGTENEEEESVDADSDDTEVDDAEEKFKNMSIEIQKKKTKAEKSHVEQKEGEKFIKPIEEMTPEELDSYKVELHELDMAVNDMIAAKSLILLSQS